jgi:hypothetical protein
VGTCPTTLFDSSKGRGPDRISRRRDEMRSALAGLERLFSHWTILDKVGRFRGLPAVVHWCTWRRRTGWPARPRGARKCHERLAGEQLGLVRLGWLTTGGRVLSRGATQASPCRRPEATRHWRGRMAWGTWARSSYMICQQIICGNSQISLTQLFQTAAGSRAIPDPIRRRKNRRNFSWRHCCAGRQGTFPAFTERPDERLRLTSRLPDRARGWILCIV